MASETDPLRPSSSSRRAASGSSRVPGLLFIRLTLVLIVALVAALTVYFNTQLERLHSEIVSDEGQIKKLQDVVSDQGEVIERFKDAVTNSDVLEKLSALEANLQEAETRMNDKLNRTEASIENRLHQTLEELDGIVTSAQQQIQQEVSKVKKDVDDYVIQTQDQFSMENSFMVYQLAGTFTLLSGLISMWHMTAHLRRFNQPIVQRKILAILWMCPIYSITSWLSLVFVNLEGYLEIIKDFYEAYVIYQFLSFLIAVLGRGDRGQVVNLLAHHSDHLKPPVRFCGCFRPIEYENARALADAVLLQCQLFAMQFVFLRPITTIAMFTCNKLHYYGGGTGSTDYRSPQFYILMIQNLSVFTAFTGLLKFYHAVQEELSWCRPFPKFLCIKGVVFMTFWQGLAIAILARTADEGVAGRKNDDDPDIWGKQAQNFLICLEMLLFSIAHFYVFPTEEWEEGYRPSKNGDKKFGDAIALRDFFSDLKLIMKGSSHGTSKPKHAKGKKKLPPKGSTVSDGAGEGDEEEGFIAARNKKGGDDEAFSHSSDVQKEEHNASGDEEEDGQSKEEASSETENSMSDIDESPKSSRVPPEVQQAAVRLLSSRFLRESWDDEVPVSSSRDEGESDHPPEHEGAEIDKEESEYGGYMGGSSNVPYDNRWERNSTGNMQTEDEEAGETTSLLGGTRSTDELLRPSIFTSFDSMNKKHP